MRIRIISIILLGLVLFTVSAAAETISFTAGDIKAVMASAKYQDPLSDQTYLWGLWSIRAMPIVSGGGFDIISGSVNDQILGDFWTYAEPSGVSWAAPYGTEAANFYLRPASEHLDTAAHPLYFIADQPANAFQSYAFNNNIDNGHRRSEFVGVCGGVDVVTGNPLAIDDSRCNPTNVLPDTAFFSFSFNLLDPEAELLGWQFLVDGSKYSRGSSPYTLWVEDFIGGDAKLSYEPFRQSEYGGGLTHNVGSGYQVLFPVPEPSTLILVGLGFAAIAIARRRV